MTVERPEEVGSFSAAWAWPRIVVLVLSALVCEFWDRYWLSRNVSRIRVIEVMSTPVPSCEPSPVLLDRAVIVSALRSVRFTSWRE